METKILVQQIDAEILLLQRAKAALLGTAVKRGPGRPKKNSLGSRPVATHRVKRTMSEEGKARIAAAQKKRWAKARRAAKKATLVAA